MERINEDAVRKVSGAAPVPGAEAKEEEKGVDSGLSTIEKSKAVRPELVPPMSTPILAAPSNMESMAFAVASVDATGRPMLETITSFVLKGENEIKSSIWKKYAENLREIAEYVRQLLSSPLYIQMQEILRKGDPHSSNVSGVQGAASAAAEAKSEPGSYLSSLDRLHAMERVHASAEVPEPSAPQDSSQVLVLPLAAALLAGRSCVWIRDRQCNKSFGRHHGISAASSDDFSSSVGSRSHSHYQFNGRRSHLF